MTKLKAPALKKAGALEEKLKLSTKAAMLCGAVWAGVVTNNGGGTAWPCFCIYGAPCRFAPAQRKAEKIIGGYNSGRK